MKILGYNTWLHKYIAFIIAGAFGGLSGVLWAHTAGIVSPENVVLTTSVDALLMAVLGGAGTLVGGAIGAGVVLFIREYLSTLVHWWQYVLGGVYVLVILYLPGGLMSIPERIRQWRAARSKSGVGRAGLGPGPTLTMERSNRGSESHDRANLKARSGVLLIGVCLRPCDAGLAPAAAQEELRIGFIAPMTGPFAQVGTDMTNGFNMYLEEVNGEFGGAKVKVIVEDSQAKPDTRRDQGEEAHPRGPCADVRRRRARLRRLCAGAGVDRREDRLHLLGRRGRRSHPAPARQISVFHPHRLVELAAQPSVRTMGLRSGLQEDRHHRRRLRLRLRAGRRFPEGVRGLRRQDHPEDLAAARHQGFRALYPDHQGGCRRGVFDDGRADGAAVPQAVAAIRLHQADHRRRHEL